MAKLIEVSVPGGVAYLCAQHIRYISAPRSVLREDIEGIGRDIYFDTRHSLTIWDTPENLQLIAKEIDGA